MPLPSDDTTPPVTTTILAISLYRSVGCRARAGRSGPLRRSARFERGQLFGGVDAGERMFAEDDANPHAAFDGAQLFEALRALERARRPRRELQQQLAPERVHARVPQRGPAARGAGEGRAREVERETVGIDHDLHDVLGQELR